MKGAIILTSHLRVLLAHFIILLFFENKVKKIGIFAKKKAEKNRIVPGFVIRWRAENSLSHWKVSELSENCQSIFTRVWLQVIVVESCWWRAVREYFYSALIKDSSKYLYNFLLKNYFSTHIINFKRIQMILRSISTTVIVINCQKKNSIYCVKYNFILNLETSVRSIW